MKVKRNQEELIMYVKDLLSLDAGYKHETIVASEKFTILIGNKVNRCKVQEATGFPGRHNSYDIHLL